MFYQQGDYYRGDYYRGDYYRGDPGLFGFLGKVAKTVGRIGIGAATGYITGGGIKGAIVGAAGGAGEATVANIRSETLAAGGEASAYTPAMRARHAEIVARGGAGLITRGGLANQGGIAPAGMALATGVMPHLRRMHANRSTYVTRGGGTSRWPVGIQVHPKGTELVPSRRMNVFNPRAARRAARRLAGLGKGLLRIRRVVGRAATALGSHRGRGRALSRVRRK
jgi:hypothetical protein